MKTPKSYIVLLLLFSIYSVQFIPAQNNLIVKLNDGSETRTLLSSLDKITFSSGNMMLKKTDSSTAIFLLSDVTKMSFGFYNAVSSVFTDDNSLAIYPNPVSDFIRIKNPPEGQINISVIGLDGIVLLSETLSDSSQPIDITKLRSGLYLLRVNNKTMKFIKG